MTRSIRKSLTAALAAAAIGAAALTTPAMANGSLSLSILPGDPQHAQAMNAGLQIFSLINGIQQGAHVHQNGNNNSGGIAQGGPGNHAIVFQEGNGHNGTIQQNGSNNGYGLFQFGQNTNAHIVQNGHGQSGLTFQYGW